jgi:hypothetical protein
VRDRIGPVAAFKTVVAIKRLPKTRSGKILRAHDAENRRQGRLEDAGDHRRSGDPGRDHGMPTMPTTTPGR